MNKTIEELAKQYAEDMCPAEDYSDSDCDDGRDTDIAISIDDARSVLRWFFNRHISSRLTEAEKEQFRKMYKRMVMNVENSDSYGCIHASKMDCAMETLDRIFGEDFFMEDKL